MSNLLTFYKIVALLFASINSVHSLKNSLIIFGLISVQNANKLPWELGSCDVALLRSSVNYPITNLRWKCLLQNNIVDCSFLLCWFIGHHDCKFIVKRVLLSSSILALQENGDLTHCCLAFIVFSAVFIKMKRLTVLFVRIHDHRFISGVQFYCQEEKFHFENVCALTMKH